MQLSSPKFIHLILQLKTQPEFASLRFHSESRWRRATFVILFIIMLGIYKSQSSIISSHLIKSLKACSVFRKHIHPCLCNAPKFRPSMVYP